MTGPIPLWALRVRAVCTDIVLVNFRTQSGHRSYPESKDSDMLTLIIYESNKSSNTARMARARIVTLYMDLCMYSFEAVSRVKRTTN
jgi:hypothetical protein